MRELLAIAAILLGVSARLSLLEAASISIIGRSKQHARDLFVSRYRRPGCS
jgi:hypothetical protein